MLSGIPPTHVPNSIVLKTFARRTSLAAALLLTVPAVAGAQSLEDALLEQDPLEAQGLELEERAREEKVEVGDPDPKLRQQVNERRAELEKRLNALQIAQPRFVKTDGPIEKLVSDFIKTQDDFLKKQAGLAQKYEAAVVADDQKASKKLADDLVKVRKGFLSGIDKLAQRADKLQAEREKLLEKYKKEQAEEAEESGD